MQTIEDQMTNGIYSLKGKRVWVAGHRGLIGSAIVRRLAGENCELLTVARSEVDLRDQGAVDAWLAQQQPDAVFIAAGRVGGIVANNTLRAEFIHDNLAIASNIIGAAHRCGVEKLMFLGSNCIYPRDAAQPIREETLLTGPLEPTNEPYAIAKLAGIKLCEAYRYQFGSDFISVIPASLYGPGDNYHPDHSHVMAALIRRFHEAKLAGAAEVIVWGSGRPRREFVFVDDMADALIFVMQRYSEAQVLNIGAGDDISIADLATAIAKAVGYAGSITFDPSKLDGMPRKLLDSSRIRDLGWAPSTVLNAGIASTHQDFVRRSSFQ